MTTIHNLPFKHKLLWIVMACSASALALGTLGFMSAELFQLQRAMPRDLRILARIIGENAKAPLAFNDSKFARDTLLASLVSNPRITRAAIYDAEGLVFADYIRDKTLRLSVPVPKVQPRGYAFDLQNGCLELFEPMLNDKDPIGTVYLRSDLNDVRVRLWAYGIVTLVVMVLALGSSFGVGLWLQRFLAKPVEALAKTAKEVTSNNDYGLRACKYADDELGTLTDTFNGMLCHIEKQNEALRESRHRFEVAVLGADDGLWDWDLKTNAVYFSPRWKSMLGYLDDELPNELATFFGRVHPEDMLRVETRLRDYLDGHTPVYAVEFRMSHKQGGYRWILARGAALRDMGGQPYRLAGAHTDITARKLAEEEIRLAREKFESLVNSIHGIVWEAEPVAFRMLFVSSQCEALLGYPAALWLEEEQFWVNAVHPDDRDATIASRKRGLAEGKPYQLEFRMVAADGGVVWVRESISVSMRDGAPYRVCGVAIDISEQHRASQELERMQKDLLLASRQAGMAEVATGVLHNVGNVLNSVNVSAGLILDKLRSSRAASLKKATHLMNKHAADLGTFLTKDPKGSRIPHFLDQLAEHLITENQSLQKETESLEKNLTHIKQIVASQQRYARVAGAIEQLDPKELMEDALRITGESESLNGFELIREYGGVPALSADRHKVMQILVNLLRNAQQALSESDAKPKQITLGIGNSSEGRICFRVSDNGKGILPEDLVKVFRHGFTTKREGHGFGLHSGANTAKEMGGSLIAYSDGPGRGACFTLELPQAPEVKAKMKQAA